MKVQDMQTLIELQALQSLTSSNNTVQESTSSLFQEMLASFLSDKNTLGSTNTALESESSKTANALLFNQPTTLSYSVPALPTSTPGKFEEIIQAAAERFNVPSKLISSVIQHESNFDVTAQSNVGASGLMQLMPSTAKWLGVKNVWDPTENIMAGTKYLRQMLDKYDGNTTLALAAYNAGPGNVDKYNGIPPFKETQNYVKKIQNSLLS